LPHPPGPLAIVLAGAILAAGAGAGFARSLQLTEPEPAPPAPQQLILTQEQMRFFEARIDNYWPATAATAAGARDRRG
jgi:hypothetical protein